MTHTKFKQNALLFALLLPAVWCGAISTELIEGHNPINVKGAHVEGTPKGHTIKASIDGHTLTVLFTENLGQVDVEITTAAGATVQTFWVSTPDGLQTYVPNVGNYIYHELYVEFGRPYAVN